MPAKIYTEKDADLSVFKGQTLAVIGFGSQGHAHAMNLKDSGCNVIIGLTPRSKSRKVAEDYGFKVYDTEEAAKKGDVIFMAVPDTRIGKIYKKSVEPHLEKGNTLLFSHGFAIHYKTVDPPEDINVIMVAPKGPGHTVRSQFVDGKGVPSLIAIHQDPGKKNAKKIALAWAHGVGGTRAGVFQTTFEEGDVTVGPKIIDASTKKRMERVLKRIQNGTFAKEWIKEDEEGQPNFKELRKDGEKHDIEKVGKRLRNTMPWLKKRDLKGAQAAYH